MNPCPDEKNEVNLLAFFGVASLMQWSAVERNQLDEPVIHKDPFDSGLSLETTELNQFEDNMS